MTLIPLMDSIGNVVGVLILAIITIVSAVAQSKQKKEQEARRKRLNQARESGTAGAPSAPSQRPERADAPWTVKPDRGPRMNPMLDDGGWTTHRGAPKGPPPVPGRAKPAAWQSAQTTASAFSGSSVFADLEQEKRKGAMSIEGSLREQLSSRPEDDEQGGIFGVDIFADSAQDKQARRFVGEGGRRGGRARRGEGARGTSDKGSSALGGSPLRILLAENRDALVKGILMAEVLGPPLAFRAAYDPSQPTAPEDTGRIV